MSRKRSNKILYHHLVHTLTDKVPMVFEIASWIINWWNWSIVRCRLTNTPRVTLAGRLVAMEAVAVMNCSCASCCPYLTKRPPHCSCNKMMQDFLNDIGGSQKIPPIGEEVDVVASALKRKLNRMDKSSLMISSTHLINSNASLGSKLDSGISSTRSQKDIPPTTNSLM